MSQTEFLCRQFEKKTILELFWYFFQSKTMSINVFFQTLLSSEFHCKAQEIKIEKLNELNIPWKGKFWALGQDCSNGYVKDAKNQTESSWKLKKSNFRSETNTNVL